MPKPKPVVITDHVGRSDWAVPFRITASPFEPIHPRLPEVSPVASGSFLRLPDHFGCPHPRKQEVVYVYQDRTGPDWTGPDLTGQDQTRQDRTGPDQTRPDGIGPDWTGPDRTGPDQTGPDWTGPDRTRTGPKLLFLNENY